MTPTHTPLGGPWGLHFLRRAAAASAAVAGMALLAGGVPWLLWSVAGTPWPDHAISLDEIKATLVEPLPDSLAIKALASAGWFFWAGFLYTLARETAWYATHLPELRRDRQRHRVHLDHLPVSRALAAACLGTLFLALLVPSRPTSATSQETVTTVQFTPPAGAAELHPSPAVATAGAATVPVPRRPPGPGETYVVRTGDTLWDIAAAELGDPLKWPQIYGLSKHTRQPDGRYLFDPDLIYPGWRLTLPAPAARSHLPAPSHSRRPTSPAAPQDSEPDAPSTGGHGQTPQHRAPEHHQSETDRRQQTAPNAKTPVADARDGERPVAIGLGEAGVIGITTAVAITAALAYFRAHQRRRHRPGQDASDLPPLPSEVATAVRFGRAAATPTTGLDTDEPDEPDGPDDPGEPDEEQEHTGCARRLSPAAPALAGTVTVGTLGGREVPLNALAVPGGISWHGPGVYDALRALLVAVLTAKTTPGRTSPAIVLDEALARELLPRIPNHPRLHLVASCAEACTLADHHLLTQARTADERLDTPATDEAAQDGNGPESLMLLVVRPEPRAADRLTMLAARGAADGLLVLAVEAFPGAAAWHIAANGTLSTASRRDRSPLPVDRLFRLTQQAAANVLDLVHTPEPQAAHPRNGFETRRPDATQFQPAAAPTRGASTPDWTQPPAQRTSTASGASQSPLDADDAPAPPEGTSEPIPTTPAAQPPPTARPESPPVRLAVLGPPTLHLTGSGEPIGTGLRDQVREFLALLAAHPAGLSNDEVAHHLQLQGTPKQIADELGLMRRAVRRVLRTATGQDEAPCILVHRERNHLDTSLIDTDVAAFTHALERAAAASTASERVHQLRQAVAAYPAPFADGTGYRWTEEICESLHRKAVDALTRLADHLADVDEALDLLDRAATFNPTNEAIYQRIIRLQLQDGRDDAAHRTLQLLTRRLAGIDAEPSAASLRLLDLSSPPAATASR